MYICIYIYIYRERERYYVYMLVSYTSMLQHSIALYVALCYSIVCQTRQRAADMAFDIFGKAAEQQTIMRMIIMIIVVLMIVIIIMTQMLSIMIAVMIMNTNLTSNDTTTTDNHIVTPTNINHNKQPKSNIAK